MHACRRGREEGRQGGRESNPGIHASLMAAHPSPSTIFLDVSDIGAYDPVGYAK